MTTQRVNESIIQQARQGDPAAFEAIMTQYERIIYAFIYRMMGDPDDAFDLTQDTFIKAFKALPRTSADLNVAAWLHRIANNACLDVLRRRMRLRWQSWEGQKHDHLLLCAAVDEPERAVEQTEARALVQRVLARMGARNRCLLLLREYEGLSTEEIGQAAGMNRTAVKSALFRARLEFARCYAVETGELPTGRSTGRESLQARIENLARGGRCVAAIAGQVGVPVAVVEAALREAAAAAAKEVA